VEAEWLPNWDFPSLSWASIKVCANTHITAAFESKLSSCPSVAFARQSCGNMIVYKSKNLLGLKKRFAGSKDWCWDLPWTDDPIPRFWARNPCQYPGVLTTPSGRQALLSKRRGSGESSDFMCNHERPSGVK
jgi:hypothetical protein